MEKNDQTNLQYENNKRENDKTKMREAKFYVVWRCTYIHGQLNEQTLPLMNQMIALKSYIGEFSRRTLSQKSHQNQNTNSLLALVETKSKTFSQTKGSKIQQKSPLGGHPNYQVHQRPECHQVPTRGSQMNYEVPP